MTNNLNYIKKTQSFIKEFEKELDPEKLGEACIELQKVNLKKEHDLRIIIQVRAAALVQWLNLIEMLDEHIEPSFDVSAGVSMKLLSGNKDDGRTSAERDKAAEDHNKKIRNYNMQVSLARIDHQVTPHAKTFIRKNYTGLPSDQLELKTAIEKGLKKTTRVEDFLKLLVHMPHK